jgi:Guanosine polyphosphate pyrophosphohydrolases/synthetases
MIPDSYSPEERKEIRKRYYKLLDAWQTRKEVQDRWMVRKAFFFAVNAHKNVRRRSGEPYIYHPIEVATIAARDIGLGRTSIISALLHDVVEDTEYTLEDISAIFGEKVARIIDGLTKIDKLTVSDNVESMQAENFRKIIASLSYDTRVVLIKLADRLHNMRTLDSMPRHKQLKIASETAYLYAPLAYRLGLYAIKSELEDLALKYTDPAVYESITQNLDKVRNQKKTNFKLSFCQ